MSNHETHETQNTQNTTITKTQKTPRNRIISPILSATIIATLALINIVSPATWAVTAWSAIWWIMTIAYAIAIPVSLYHLISKNDSEFLHWLYMARSFYAETTLPKDGFASASKLVSQSLYIGLFTGPTLLISFLFMGNTFLVIGSVVVLSLNIKAAIVWWGRDKRND